MRMENLNIVVDCQLTGPAVLHGYILDNIELVPNRKRPAVIVCAGGGYSFRSDREGEPIMLKFMEMGYHAFLLDYSVSPNRFPTSVRELASAVAAVRDHAAEWNVDAERIVVCGFSAGGHLSCSLGVYWNHEFVYGAVGRKPEEIRPDGMILCYPVITGGEFAHKDSLDNLLGESAEAEERLKVSLENYVTKDTPKSFIWHTMTDNYVSVENSMKLAEAMRKQDVNFELHIYPAGEHGLSLANEETGGNHENQIEVQCQSWVSLVKSWMKHRI